VLIQPGENKDAGIRYNPEGDFMGITCVEGKVRGPTGKEEQLRFLVDSGATYSLLPMGIWQKIELSPKREHVFTLADGSGITRKVSECYILLPQGEGYTPVILGEADVDRPNNKDP
jgi:predicted aspartyl protease